MQIEQLQKLIQEKAGGSQSAFAILIKKSPSQVNQWLTGKRPMGPKIVRDIEDALGISLRSNLVLASERGSVVSGPVQFAGTVVNGFSTQTPLGSVGSAIQDLAMRLSKIAPQEREIAAGVMASLARYPERHATYARQIESLLEFSDMSAARETPVEPKAARGM